ncbi:Transposase IS4 [Popillia japonica]|uniref:Transposase IS4 n=1 Tax=Popillia japonica TaxID=7064 RepID=A0AAW1JK18_POPJA
MCEKRFSLLLQCLRFDYQQSRATRREVDKLAAIRGVFEMFVENSLAIYVPVEYVTIDEKLETFRGRYSFRQYIPNKPAKYGIKIFAVVDARTFYVLNQEIYVGKQPALK